jgi:hypothetical protein
MRRDTSNAFHGPRCVDPGGLGGCNDKADILLDARDALICRSVACEREAKRDE